MHPLIYTNMAAAGGFMAACLVWWLPEMIGMFRQMARVSRKTASVQDRGSLVILLVLQWVGLALNFSLAWWLPGLAIPGPRFAFFLSGIILILLGVSLRWLAIWTLGRFFTRDVAVSPDQQIVQRGLYRYIRHPAYSGTFLTMLGVGLAMNNWASLLSLLCCVFLGHINRVRVEEDALVGTIGRPYIEYMQHTRRFIPFLF
jgi:protein-S-isoprenylcysteine O-methyltransferase Ste14